MKTKSEELFEELCKSRDIKFEPIATVYGSRRPDYRIWLNDFEVLVEVKQIEESDFERQLRKSTTESDSDVLISTVTKRIRGKFDKARKQLKNLSKGLHPALFVIYDNTDGLSFMDREDILNAMYGDQILRVRKYQKHSCETNHRFGGNRKLDRGHNRSVSAFAWLRVVADGRPSLGIYHNEFAEIELDRTSAKLLAETQFVRMDSVSDEYRGWVQIDGV